MNAAKPAAIYIRVSVDRGERHISPEAQTALCMGEAVRRGLSVPPEHVYTDRGISGGTTDRPDLQRLLLAVRSHAVGAVIFYNVTRLSRDVVGGRLIAAECAANACALISAASGEVDIDSPEGSFRWTIDLAVGELERRRGAKNVKDALTHKLERGEYAGGGLPFGWVHTGQAKAEIAPEQAQIVRRIFTEYAAGRGLVEIVRGLNGDGIPTPRGGPVWYITTVARILRHPAYSGIQQWAGLRGSWPFEPIVPRETVDQVRRRLEERRGAAGPHRPTSPWTGILRCRCGRVAYRTVSNAPNGRKYPYWRCAAGRRRCLGVERTCHELWFRDEPVQALTKAIVAAVSAAEPVIHEPGADVDAELQAIDARKADADWAFLDRRAISREQWGAVCRECASQRAALLSRTAGAGLCLPDLAGTWDRLTTAEQHTALSLLVETAEIANGVLTVALREGLWRGEGHGRPTPCPMVPRHWCAGQDGEITSR